MRRRTFIAAIGGAAAWPLAARAQQPTVPIVGFLSVRSLADSANDVAAFSSGLKENGYVDGQNVAVAYRWGEGDYERLKAQAIDLVEMRPSVIVGFGPVAALAVKSVTTTIPIVFTSSSDPVKAGLVASLGRPGGNVTGVSFLAVELNAKRMELLHEIVPNAKVIGTLVNPSYTNAETESSELREAARQLGQQLSVQKVGAESEIESAFDTLVKQRIDALIINGDAFFNRMRDGIIELVAIHSIPTIYPWSEYAASGGLISYGPSLSDGFRQAGVYAGAILKGSKPADLPVLQPVKFELAINVKTAKALRLDIPPSLLARADEVIE